jgi:hypothetical protein
MGTPDSNFGTKRRLSGGRKVDCNWSYFTGIAEMSPKDKASSQLEWVHCHQTCAMAGKVDRVRTDLKKCNNFQKRLTENVEKHEWPSDYVGGFEQEGAKRSKLDQQDLKKCSLPKRTDREDESVRYNTSLHFYVSGTPLVRIQSPFLRKAFQVLGQPSAKKVSSLLLP